MKKLSYIVVLICLLLLSCKEEETEKLFYATDGSSWEKADDMFAQERHLQKMRNLRLEYLVLTKEITKYESAIIAKEYTNLHSLIVGLRKHIRGTGELKRKKIYGRKKTYKAMNNEEFFTPEEAEKFDKILMQLLSLDRKIELSGVPPLKGKKPKTPVNSDSFYD